MDCVIAFFITIMIFKLRFRENDSVQDMKQMKTRLEDFCVSIPEIPIEGKDYDHKPDLLTAMLSVHLEDIVGHELQCIPEMAEMQRNEYQVMDVQYGFTNQTALEYINEMWLTCEKIADLKKKILVDPDNTRTYEAQIWQHYATVTELNDSYYEDKKAASGEVVNAYVMFRSMEGKQRAIKAYDIHCCQRLCVSFCCCLSQFFKKKQLIRKGFLTVESPVDP